MNGVLIIDKPSGLTSHDVVNRVRRILGQRSIGHLGTLDPMATGVLPLVLGSFTRLAQFYLHSEKTYEGTIRFGFATDTYDAEGEPLENSSIENVGTAKENAGTENKNVGTGAPGCPTLNLTQLQQLATEFIGVIQQTPPPFSAKKIKGVPAYKLARKHQPVDLKPVEVEIKEFAITAIDADRATFRARVASGTYMRSVAHDLGQRLGCGAHLATLRRTSVAEFDLNHAHKLEELAGHGGRDSSTPAGMRSLPLRMTESDTDAAETHIVANTTARASSTPCHSERAQSAGEEPAVMPLPSMQPKRATELQPLHQLCIHPRELLPQLPCVTADELTAARIRNGRPINLPDHSRARHVKVFANQRDLLGIATRVAGTLFHPKIVFATDEPVRD
jgi:tRNA pseudouridine55 synthase